MYEQGRRSDCRARGAAAKNERAIKTKGKGNKLKNWVSWVLSWKIFVAMPFKLASNAIMLFYDFLWLFLHTCPHSESHIAYFEVAISKS